MCSGVNNEAKFIRDCFTMSFADLDWTEQGYLPDGRITSGYAHSPHWGLVIAGGFLNEDTYTVLQTHDGVKFDSLPRLPVNSSKHCLAIIDDNRYVFHGSIFWTVYVRLY